MSDIVLYDYWRSSASYRVRIALHLLGLRFRSVPVDLLTAEHRSPAHLERNPQGLVPAIQLDGLRLTQSLAIIEYLHETRLESRLLPRDPSARAAVRALSHAIAMEIHPVCNTGVVKRLTELAGGGNGVRESWMREFITRGLDAVEAMLQSSDGGRFCHGDAPTLADCCLVPQLYNARRWDCDSGRWPRALVIESACAELHAFRAAHPDEARGE